MTTTEILQKADNIISHSHIGLLSTNDIHNNPSSRWMVPTFLLNKPGYLYCLTGEDFRKVRDIDSNPYVSWLIQKNTMDEIIRFFGTAHIKKNTELLHKLVRLLDTDLEVFWKLHPDKNNLVAIETNIQRLEYFLPFEGKREEFEM